ncbi:MAG: hypothetical protein SFV32_12980 [Opitutaceae bacterium]|nr:hypothetical protein [Opitutaceae bacterium]
MKLARTLVSLALAGIGLTLVGCSTKTNRDTSVPWNRPASWEGGIPGMGSPDEYRK